MAKIFPPSGQALIRDSPISVPTISLSIVEGTQTMTVYKPIEQEASTAAELAVRLGKGEDISKEENGISVNETFNDGSNDIPYYKITPVAVTAENMDEVIIDGGFHTREDVYLNVK